MPKEPPDLLKQEMSYNPQTGEFWWLRLDTGRKIDRQAGAVSGTGYRTIMFQKKFYAAHRLAFWFMNGAMPKEMVDHIDGDKLNNRWSNLRPCNSYENSQNVQYKFVRKHPYKRGAYFQAGKFLSQIQHKGVKRYLGRFETEEEAHNAYLDAKRRLHTFNPTI